MFSIDKLDIFLEGLDPLGVLKNYIFSDKTETIFRKAIISLVDNGYSLEKIKEVLQDSESMFTSEEISEMLGWATERLNKDNIQESEEKIIKGSNPDYKVVWNATDQRYLVYKNGKLITTKYKFSDIKSYL